ncbi:MAG TPA: hypothetical protein PK339_12730 [Flavitalea sp.]|nr:hypothetical protein [Flavitalea sp.]
MRQSRIPIQPLARSTAFRTMLAVLIMLAALSANAQPSHNIRVNNALLTDLHQAAGSLGFDGAVIVGDTISIEEDLIFNGLSLIFLCNQFMDGAHIVTAHPNKPDSTSYGTDGKGLAGSPVTVYAKRPVHGSFALPGGDGKPGENGMDGRNGQMPAGPNACCTAQNKGQPGKDGQNGSAGGNGGKLSVMALAKKDSSIITLTGDGGAGGAGGRGGKGGTSYSKANNRPGPIDPRNPGTADPNPYRITQEKDGKNGKDGKKGSAATLVVQQISSAAFQQALQKYGVDSLTASQPAFTTLINTKPASRPGQPDLRLDLPDIDTRLHN